jgi:acyl CoA:acetate/3-ketoacid CoA transferase alpha subunit
VPGDHDRRLRRRRQAVRRAERALLQQRIGLGAVRIPIVVLKGGAGPTLPGYCLAVIATEREPR